MKILIGMLSHEGDSFSPKKSELIPEHCTYHQGEDILKFYRGTRTKLGGFIEVAEKYTDKICYTESASFISSGCVSKTAFEVISKGIIKGIEEYKPDLIFLGLHGACILEHCYDGDGLLLKMVREAAGEKCIICSSFDMHAYMTFDMISNLNVLTGYKTYPHTDMYDRAKEAAEYAVNLYNNSQSLFIATTRVPLIVNAECGQTGREPIGPIIDYSIELEKQGKVLSTTVSVMQPWMNVKYAGCTATVCAYDPKAAIMYSRELAQMLWDIRSDSQFKTTPIREAINRARMLKGDGKPVLFVDSADSPGAGATCDSSYVAKYLVEYGNDLNSIGSVVDKEVVSKAWELEDGESIECNLGFKEAPMFGSPFHFRGIVERHCSLEPVIDYDNKRVYDFGKRVVLRSGNARIMVMENAGCGHSPILYTSAGYKIEDFDVVCVRSALQYKEEFEGLYFEDIVVDSPGASSLDLCSLPFNDVIWDVYPLNKDAEFIPHTKLSVRS